jgi:hypothetical protein
MDFVKFILFVIDSQTNTAQGNEIDQIDAFNDYLKANNHWVMAAGIGAPGTATLVDNRNQSGITFSGSLQNSPDFYSGFWIIESESIDEANELAKAGSAACNRRVELRRFL